MKKSNKKAFSLIELLVVIAIIGILATLAVISLQGARKGARDAKRVANIKQIQTALELYFNDEGRYPSSLNFGQGKIESPTAVYMKRLPLAPNPSDGTCGNDNTYYYSTLGEDNGSYEISFCLGSFTGELEPGPHCASPGGIESGYCANITVSPNNFNCGDSISYQGQSYATVQIGSQCWFKENLNVGTRTDDHDQSDNGIIEKNCPANDESYCDSYGGYYLKEEAMNYDSSNSQGICPSGWHIPSIEEFKTLMGPITTEEGVSADPFKDDVLWNGSNTSGFSILPSGAISTAGAFSFPGQDGSIFLSKTFLIFMLDDVINAMPFQSISHETFFSVRCLRNN